MGGRHAPPRAGISMFYRSQGVFYRSYWLSGILPDELIDAIPSGVRPAEFGFANDSAASQLLLSCRVAFRLGFRMLRAKL